jgi:hypothetical protein
VGVETMTLIEPVEDKPPPWDSAHRITDRILPISGIIYERAVGSLARVRFGTVSGR